MKKNKLIYNLLVAAGMSLTLFACSDDDEGTSAGFAGIASSYMEADGTGTVFIPFRDGTVKESSITVDGSATEGSDYTLSYSDDGITVTVTDDDAAEKLETIRFMISGASGESNSIHTLIIVSDDPGLLYVELTWAADVDLDLISWYFDETDDSWHDLDFSDPGNNLDPIDWTDPDGLYGFTYNYYDGDVASVPFSAVFTPVGVTLEGGTDPLTFNATYTLANVDPNNVQIEQTVTKTGTAFTDFSDIEVPAEGSRKAEILNKLKVAAAELHAKRRSE